MAPAEMQQSVPRVGGGERGFPKLDSGSGERDGFVCSAHWGGWEALWQTGPAGRKGQLDGEEAGLLRVRNPGKMGDRRGGEGWLGGGLGGKRAGHAVGVWEKWPARNSRGRSGSRI